jgi:hypothetical protein
MLAMQICKSVPDYLCEGIRMHRELQRLRGLPHRRRGPAGPRTISPPESVGNIPDRSLSGNRDRCGLSACGHGSAAVAATHGVQVGGAMSLRRPLRPPRAARRGIR